jgi:hypothetical protein
VKELSFIGNNTLSGIARKYGIHPATLGKHARTKKLEGKALELFAMDFSKKQKTQKSYTGGVCISCELEKTAEHFHRNYSRCNECIAAGIGVEKVRRAQTFGKTKVVESFDIRKNPLSYLRLVN